MGIYLQALANIGFSIGGIKIPAVLIDLALIVRNTSLISIFQKLANTLVRPVHRSPAIHTHIAISMTRTELIDIESYALSVFAVETSALGLAVALSAWKEVLLEC